MTAIELIKILQAQPPDMEVCIWFRDYWNDPKDRGVRTVRLQDAKAFLMAAVVDDEDAISELKP